ncbi:hypothetical protein NM208_g9434 [Fusarium decemcellulare]|uniref:Uncharacterized protein n=1 Tax=Fusarium decemcellulare TaxID=57161 RepID=A0ACC1S242_9HYPO|nr:hypothetical protein NM208_g9434 [Fusarium decemcellulare]
MSSKGNKETSRFITPSLFNIPTSPGPATQLNVTPIPLSFDKPFQRGRSQTIPSAVPSRLWSEQSVPSAQPLPQLNKTYPGINQSSTSAVYYQLPIRQPQQPAGLPVDQVTAQQAQSATHPFTQQQPGPAESTPLATQLLNHHHHRQASMPGSSSLSGLLPVDYGNYLENHSSASQGLGGLATPSTKPRPNVQFGLSPLPVSRHPTSQLQPSPAMFLRHVRAEVVNKPSFMNYREPTVTVEVDSEGDQKMEG